ncbi:MAG: ATP-binding protein, partial [Pseudomonadota bacterium]
ADTGIGIDPRHHAKAMASFGQVDSGLSRRHEGLGLGLPLSRRLMEMHGGTLELDSTPGRGTVVTLRFPPERTRPVAA